MTNDQVPETIEEEQLICNECEKPMPSLDLNGYDTELWNGVINRAGWYATRGLGRILCPLCAKEWGAIV